MSDTPANINGALLRLKREERGWLVSDMATRACMSIKQIRQLEEGGASSFYSESVKLTSAKKVGAILGLTADEVFGLPAQDLRSSHEPQDEASTESVSTVSSDGGNDATHDSVQPETVSAQQGASTLPQSSDDITASSASASASASAPQDLVASTERAVETEAEKKGKTPFVAMLALFVAALAIAAWMRPEAEPVAVEPPPPLQNIPAEGADAPASAASSEMETPASVASTTAASAALSSASPTAAASASPASLPVAPAAPTAPKAATATTVPATPATQAQLATPSAVPPAAKSSAAAAPASVPASKPQ